MCHWWIGVIAAGIVAAALLIEAAVPNKQSAQPVFVIATGQIVAPPINRMWLPQAPAIFGEQNRSAPDGKTVIVV